MTFLSAFISSQLLSAMLMLYLFLGLTSAGVSYRTRLRPDSQLRAQVNSWWSIFPVVSASLLCRDVGAPLLALLVALLALRELSPHAAPAVGFFQCRAAAALALLLGCWRLPALAAVLLLAFALQLLLFLRQRRRDQLPWLLMLLTCCAVSFLMRYAALPFGPGANLAWLFYLYVLTALNDVAQFISGSVFGKHRIAPGISPNKTAQGLAGGIAATVALSLALGGHLRLADAPTLAWFGLLLSLGGFAGDLLFSAAKRKLGIKDFSQLIPGHGGILDRVDSLVVTAPLLYFLIQLTLEGHAS